MYALDKIFNQKYRDSEILKRFEPAPDYILVDPDPDKGFQRILGPNGQPVDLQLDTRWSKEHNSMSGLIVGLPRYCSPEIGYDVSHLQVGDRLYFHFNCLSISQEASLGIEDDGHWYAMIPVDLAYCVTRGEANEIHMVGEHILVEPVLQTPEDIETASGIQFESRRKPKYLEGMVVECGPNIKGNPTEIKPGDHVLYLPDADFPLMVAGHEWYCMKHQWMMAVLDGKMIQCPGCGLRNMAEFECAEQPVEYKGQKFDVKCRYCVCPNCRESWCTDKQLAFNTELMEYKWQDLYGIKL